MGTNSSRCRRWYSFWYICRYGQRIKKDTSINGKAGTVNKEQFDNELKKIVLLYRIDPAAHLLIDLLVCDLLEHSVDVNKKVCDAV